MNTREFIITIIHTIENNCVTDYNIHQWKKDKLLLYKFMEQELDIPCEEFYYIMSIINNCILRMEYWGK